MTILTVVLGGLAIFFGLSAWVMAVVMVLNRIDRIRWARQHGRLA